MNKKVLFLFVVLIIISTSCNQQSFYPETENSITESPNIVEGVPPSGSETKNNYQESYGNLDIEKLKIYGTWSLDKIVLTSKDYIGEKNWGDGHIFNEKQYVGYEIEYTPEYFRLGEQKFFSPTYEVLDFTFYNFNNNGDFESPDLYDFVEKEGIKVDKMEEYENIDDIPLAYYLVAFKENYFIPVGTQIVLLNENTMLVGVWGDIILAHRAEI
ncbi:MAG: hypothetical protein LBS02_21655 [Hungatella sp.]|jgi:hypothetical protein|nr:hypothetical protein [Hungatella sp.]